MQRWLKTNSTPNEKQTLLALLRHGQTVWNEEGRIQGHADSPLSRKGIQQVKEWTQFLSTVTIHNIIASDLGRVRETVSIIQNQLKNVSVEWNASLQEQAWGAWQGKTFADLRKNHGEILKAQIQAGWEFRPPGGESRKEVLQRALPVIQNITQDYPGKNILVVCHEGIIKSLIYHLAKRNFLPEEKKLLQKRDLHLLQGNGNELSIARLNVMTNLKNNNP